MTKPEKNVSGITTMIVSALALGTLGTVAIRPISYPLFLVCAGASLLMLGAAAYHLLR